MLVLARQARGYTQVALAEKLDIGQGTLSKIEMGFLDEVSDKLLNTIVDVLEYPKTFFFEEGDIFPPAALPQFRKKASLKNKAFDKIEANSNIKRMHIQKLLKAAETDVKIEYFDLDEYNNDPAEIARAVRRSWNVPKGPIQNLTELIENVGIIIIENKFETDELDAFTINDGRNPPLIFINKNLLGDRQRFTVAHELAHLLMHRIPVADMEIQANVFASEFLVPADEVKEQFVRVDLAHFANLKTYWKVSIAALITKAKDLGVINGNQYKYLFMQMSKLGYRKREPAHFDIPKEKPTLLKEIIELHMKDLGYSFTELSKILCISEKELEELYFDKPVLRLLK